MTEQQGTVKQIVEGAIASLRQSFENALAVKDNEIANIRALLVQRELQIQELQHQTATLQRNYTTEHTRATELTKKLVQLYEFKKSVVHSLSASQDDGLDVDIDAFSQIQFTDASQMDRHADIGIVADSAGVAGLPDPTMTESRKSHQKGNGYNRKKPVMNIESESNSTLNLRPYGSNEMVSEEEFGQPGPLNTSIYPSHPPDINTNNRGRDNATLDHPTYMQDTLQHQLPQQQHNPRQMDKNSDVAAQGRSDGHESAIDGRDFFKSARTKLSYDEFTALLWNVKAYNKREINKQTTLKNLQGVFGSNHPDLYHQFEMMIAQ